MSFSHYCIWGLCESWEYCCGDNVCCREAEFNSLHLMAAILGTLIILAPFSIYFYCTSRRLCVPFIKKYFRISYSLMSVQRDSNADSVVKGESLREDYVLQVEKTNTSL